MSSQPGAPATLQQDDAFPLGWRDVRQVDADGVEHWVPRALTAEDVLHPEEGDFIVQNHLHFLFIVSLALSIGRLLFGKSGVRYRVDHRVDWGHATIRPHGPDVVVFDNGVEPNPARATLHLVEQGSRPLVVFEVTSPSTRTQDLVTKVDHYYRVGVPVYIIVDQGPDPANHLRLRLLGYQAGPDAYEPLPLDDRGRLHVEPLGLVLAIEDDWLVCYDESGHLLADRTEIGQRMAEIERDLAGARDALVTMTAELTTTRETLSRTSEELAAERERANRAEQQARELAAELERLRRQVHRPAPPESEA